MSNPLPRRTFLKIATGAATVTGLSAVTRSVGLEPFVQPPEHELPGRGTWYASACLQCPAGCGTIVRVINGRPRKIEGNPAHPLNRGKLCARGQASLQTLYDPDRLRNAVRQTGGRGSRQFAPVSWNEALDEMTNAYSDLKDPGSVAFLSGWVPDHLYTLASIFLETQGAQPPVVFDLHTALESRVAAVDMAQRWFSIPRLPIYDISRAEVVFSFGANFLETWMSPVAQSVDYGTMRQGQLGGRGFLVHFEPRMSSTAACADEWIPVEPGSEGLIALGIGRIIVEENLGRAGSHREHADLYRNVSVGEISEATGIPSVELRRLAQVFAGVERSVAIPGGRLGGHTNGSEAMDAVMALNVIMRRLGREGGVFLPQDVPVEPFMTPLVSSSFHELARLVDRMRSGEVEILFIHGCNPVYELPSWTGFKEALTRVPTVISFCSVIDETAVQADWVLPDHTQLESWGYQIIASASDRPIVSNQQPVTQPLYETRSTADVFLNLAGRLGGQVATNLPWADEVEYLEEAASSLFGSSIGVFDARTPAGFWSRWRQYGGWWSENPIRVEPEVSKSLTTPLQIPTASFVGDQGSYPFYLLPYESLTLSDGRGAQQPWLQEAPDPMTTARWTTWVELHPDTAKSLGVTDNDLVRVSSPHGEIEAPVVVYPGIRPDTVAIPTGQGHEDLGRFASGRGSNVMSIVAPSQENKPDDLTWGATRVRIEPTGRVKIVARLESLDGAGRESIR